jgi:hypothetical protein
MSSSQNAQIYFYDSDEDDEDEVTSPYRDVIELNEDDYWDVYFEPSTAVESMESS